MGVKEVFEIAGAVLVSTGCGGAIIFGLSSWLGKVWANRILENEKAEHSKELEKYKKELAEELEHVKSFNDKALYVSKAQYDNEYRIYLELWELLHTAVVFTKMLYPKLESRPIDELEFRKFQEEKYKQFVDAYNLFSMAIDKYAPFYRKDFYKEYKKVRELCHSLGVDFSTFELEAVDREKMPKEVHREVYRDIPKALDEAEDDLQERIRTYLLSLQLI